MNAFEQLEPPPAAVRRGARRHPGQLRILPAQDRDDGARRCGSSIQTLAPLQPRFVSVTYGAGGSTRERTHATVERILKETALTPAAHLTCVGATRDEVDAIARDYWELGVRNIVALRGDPPEPGRQVSAASRRLSRCGRAGRRPQGGRAVRHFGRGLSRNPPGFARSRQFDLDNLKRKVDAGADRAITQFFFSADCFFRFRDEAAAAGHRRRDRARASCRSRTSRPRAASPRPAARASRDWLDELFEGLDDLPAARQLIAATVAAELCGQLYAGGVRHFHFYTLNRAELSYAICHLLGVRAQSMSAAERLPRRSRQAHPDQGRRLRHRDPGRAAAERRLLRRPRPAEGPARQQRPAQPHPARDRPLDLRELRRCRRRDPRHQHLQRQRHQPGRLRRRGSGRARSTAHRREIIREVADRYSARDGKPRWVAGALGPTNKTLSLSPNVNDPGYPRGRFRPGQGGLSRADRRAGRGRRRLHPDRDDLRHAERQGRDHGRRWKPSRRSAASCR